MNSAKPRTPARGALSDLLPAAAPLELQRLQALCDGRDAAIDDPVMTDVLDFDGPQAGRSSVAGDSEDNPAIPPPGRRCGEGAQSVLPYLQKTLALKPQHDCAAGDGPVKTAADQPRRRTRTRSGSDPRKA